MWNSGSDLHRSGECWGWDAAGAGQLRAGAGPGDLLEAGAGDHDRYKLKLWFLAEVAAEGWCQKISIWEFPLWHGG